MEPLFKFKYSIIFYGSYEGLTLYEPVQKYDKQNFLWFL